MYVHIYWSVGRMKQTRAHHRGPAEHQFFIIISIMVILY